MPFAAANISPDGEGQEGADMKLLHHSYSTNGVRPFSRYDSLRISQGFGEVSREALYTAAGLRGAAALSSLKHFRFLNQNRYIRIGKGNIPRGRPFTDGPGQNVPTLRIGNGKPSPINHIDLRLWGY